METERPPRGPEVVLDAGSPAASFLHDKYDLLEWRDAKKLFESRSKEHQKKQDLFPGQFAGTGPGDVLLLFGFPVHSARAQL